MNLPPMAPAASTWVPPLSTPPEAMPVPHCWRDRCGHAADPANVVGLCDRHLTELRNRNPI